jgi:hypothetical protein
MPRAPLPLAAAAAAAAGSGCAGVSCRGFFAAGSAAPSASPAAASAPLVAAAAAGSGLVLLLGVGVISSGVMVTRPSETILPSFPLPATRTAMQHITRGTAALQACKGAVVRCQADGLV